ncbi:hypothetical protein GWD52_21025 [Enterobacteriaceae bacterium 4M9]|nr:hypothetical protein [Enterobacteriaceae bacterium 4M9]
MERIPLSEYVSRKSQELSAAMLGCRQSAISKALAVGREITVITKDDGTVEAWEWKRVLMPKQK